MGEIRIKGAFTCSCLNCFFNRHKNSNDAFYFRMSYELSDLVVGNHVYVANKVRLTE